MIRIVLGFVLLVCGSVAFFVVIALRRVGHMAGGRAKMLYGVSYIVTLGSLIGLSTEGVLGRGEWWLPVAVYVAIGVSVGLPLHVWSKRKLARTPKNDLWKPT